MSELIAQGNILKMHTDLDSSNQVIYHLPIGAHDETKQEVLLNQLIGKGLKLEFTGVINCIDTGKKIKKTFNNGYSYPSFLTRAACDICIVKPELCHYKEGTCREPEWGEEHCLRPHIVYIANSSGIKIGITREVNMPYRWIDQGALQALPILKVKDRLTSGKIEVKLKNDFADKTSWQKMLKNTTRLDNLIRLRSQIYEKYERDINRFQAEKILEDVLEIEYPLETPPEKVKSMSFDKMDTIEGTLIGIKGQYLIFDTGVVNVRKHQGYYLKLWVL
jgi:hypothetical protein